MIRRPLAWARGVLADLRAGLQDLRDYSAYERAVVEAATYGVSPAEIDDATCFVELHGPYFSRVVLVVRALVSLSIVGIVHGHRTPIIAGMSLRYLECAGRIIPDRLGHNCVTALSVGIERGWFRRSDLYAFIEAFPQFRSSLGNEPTPEAVLNWFLEARDQRLTPPACPNYDGTLQY